MNRASKCKIVMEYRMRRVYHFVYKIQDLVRTAVQEAEYCTADITFHYNICIPTDATYMLPVDVTPSYSDSVEMRYVLPVV